MTTFLPKEVAEGLEAARKQALRKKSRLRVQAGTEIFTVLKYWDSGFSVDSARCAAVARSRGPLRRQPPSVSMFDRRL